MNILDPMAWGWRVGASILKKLSWGWGYAQYPSPGPVGSGGTCSIQSITGGLCFLNPTQGGTARIQPLIGGRVTIHES